MISVITDIREWEKVRAEIGDRSLGFVPTMGALHKGHISLVNKSVRENDITVASIFVNPTQFNDPADLRSYPKTFEKDKMMLDDAGVKYLFKPSYDALYPDNYKYKVVESDFSRILCGAKRPGHFDGVLTVVMKLLNIIKADKAYFGEKDFQQLNLIEGMVEAFFLNTEIVPGDLIRDDDGLALSSRNSKLSEEERNKALEFPRLLKSDLSEEEIAEELEANGIKVDYIEKIGNRRFGAVFIGNVRLIDNVEI